MKDKFVMILGIGSSKFLQILFAFYLSYRFDHGALVTFFLILSLGVAMSSVVSLGGAPQIIRAGAFSDPMEHIISTIKTAAIFIIISLIILSLYITQGEYVWNISNFNKVNYYFDTMLILISLSLNSIIQSYLSYKQDYFKLGITILLIYSIAFSLGVIFSLYIVKESVVILIYCLSFFILSLGAFIFTVNSDITLRKNNIKSKKNKLIIDMLNFVKVSAFGFITMFSLFFIAKYINNTYSKEAAAVYFISFQFFQIGIFIPGILGSIVIPKLVKNDMQVNIKKYYILISLFWLLFSLSVFYPLFKVYRFEFSTSYILTFFIMQFSVILASIQAFYIQNYVALGNFNSLAFITSIWGGALLSISYFSPHKIYFSSIAIVISYFITILIFSYKEHFIQQKRNLNETL